MAVGALLLPGVGDVLTLYAPPLVVAKLLGGFARNERFTVASLTPYVLTFAALWLTGQVVWRIAVALIARVEIRGMVALYVESMDELLGGSDDEPETVPGDELATSRCSMRFPTNLA